MKNIKPKAPVTCTNSIVIDSSAFEVWEVLTAINKWPEWNKAISKSRLLGPLQAGSRFKWKTGGISISSILLTVIPYTSFGWSGKSLGISAIHTWNITELKRVTEVRVEESLQGLIPRLFNRILTKTIEKNMQKWLEFLKDECELKQRVAA